jgi:hypothetical protein
LVVAVVNGVPTAQRTWTHDLNRPALVIIDLQDKC